MRAVVLLALATCACGRIAFDPIELDDDFLVLPEGGVITRIAYTGDGSIRYALGYADVYVSTDGGESWARCEASQARGNALAVASDGRVLLATDDDVYASSDGCATWQPTGLGLGVADLVISSNILYAASTSGLRRRVGETWDVVATPLEGRHFTSIAVERSGALWLAGTRFDGIVRSDDGVTWTPANQGLNTRVINRVAVGAGGSASYALQGATDLTNDATSCSPDGGATWIRCSVISGVAAITHPTQPATAILGMYDDIFRTRNGGAGFEMNLRSSAMDVARPRDFRYLPDGTLVVATDRGLFEAGDDLAWQPRHAGLAAWSILSLFVDGEGLWAGTQTGVLRSIGGGPFELSSRGMTSSGFSYEIERVGDVLFAAGRHLRRSLDFGDTWVEVYNATVSDRYAVTSLTSDGSRAFAGTRTGVLWADPPYESWTRRQIAGADREVNAVALQNGALWVATEQGLFVATDPVGALAAVSFDETIRVIATRDDGALLLGGPSGVWIGNGDTGFALQPVGAVRALAARGQTIAASIGRSVVLSYDGGDSWPKRVDFDVNAVAIALDPVTGDLVVGTEGRGLWRGPSRR